MKPRITLFLFCFLMSGFCASITAWAACSGPPGNAGDIMYNADYHVPQYCDGANWMQMGQKQGAGGSGCAAPPVSLVQVQNNIDITGTAFTTFSVNITTTPGDFLVAFVRESSNNTDTFTVTDSAGRTWTQTSSGYADESGTGPRTGMFYIANSAAVTSVTAHYTTGGGAIKPGIMVMEFSNMATGTVADGSVNNASLATATTSTSGSLTTSSANDILIFATDTSGDTSTSWTAGAGYAIPNYNAPPSTGSSSYGDNIRMAVQWKSVSSTQTGVTTTMTYNPTNWNGNIFAAFKAGPSASEGDVIYNADKHVPQFCDGTNWIPMAEGYPTSGLVGWWKLDEGSGTTTADSSGNGMTGTLNNSPTWGAGKLGNALTFNGTSQYVNIPYAAPLNLPGSWTVATWFKLTSFPTTGNYYELLALEDGTNNTFTFFVADNYCGASGGNADFNVNYNNGGGTAACQANNVTTGIWYHGAAVYDSLAKNLYLYLNGSLAAMASETAAPAVVSTGALTLGKSPHYATYAPATLDDVRIYNRALSDAEIARLAMVPTSASCNPSASGLVGWWRLDEASGTTAADSSGNGNTGTLGNSPTWTTGKINGALKFVAASWQDITFSAPPSTGGAWTVSGWAKLSSTPGSGIRYTMLGQEDLMTSEAKFVLYADNSAGTGWAVDFEDSSNVSHTARYATTLTTGTWYHVAGTWDGTTLTLYVNGVSVATNIPGAVPNTSGIQSFLIGTDGGSNNPVDATLDDVRVYSRALSASEIVNLCLGGKEGDITYNSDAHVPQYCDGTNWQQLGSRKITAPSGSGSGLVGWWKLDDGTGNLTDGENASNELGQNPASFTTSTAATTQAGASHPTDIAYDAVHGRLFVADTNNNRVLVYDTSAVSDGMNAVHELGQNPASFTTSTAATTQAGMSAPEGLSYDSVNDRLFVADLNNSRVLEYDLSGGITDGMNAAHVLGQSNFTSSSQVTTQSGMYWDYGVAYDSANNRLFVSDGSNNRVLEYDLSGGITDGMNAAHVLGQANFASGQYNRCTCATPAANTMYGPRGVTYDPVNNRLFLADANNNRVLEFDLSGGITDGMNATYELGQPSGTAFTTRGSATTQAGMQFPTGVGFDAAHDRLFVADYYNNRVTEFDLIGGITNGMNAAHVLGQGSFAAGANATTQAGLYYPYNSAYDAANNRLFVSDADNNRVMVFPATSSPTTAVDSSGNGNTGTLTNGPTWTTGKTGGALTFSYASSQYVNVPDVAGLRFGTGNFTVAAWIKFPISGSLAWDGIVTKGWASTAPAHSWGLVRNSTNTNQVTFQDATDAGGTFGDCDPNSATVAAGWHHIVVTRTATACTIYTDGVAGAPTNGTVANLNTTAPLKIGGDDEPRYLGGSIDDVRIYNRALSATEIRDLYDATSN